MEGPTVSQSKYSTTCKNPWTILHGSAPSTQLLSWKTERFMVSNLTPEAHTTRGGLAGGYIDMFRSEKLAHVQDRTSLDAP